MVRLENLGLRKTHTPKLVALLLKQLVSVPTAPFSLASKFFQHYPNDRGFYTNFTVLGHILIFGASFDTILVLFISIFMTEFFQTILYIPLFNGFVGVYALIPDVGIVIKLSPSGTKASVLWSSETVGIYFAVGDLERYPDHFKLVSQ